MEKLKKVPLPASTTPLRRVVLRGVATRLARRSGITLLLLTLSVTRLVAQALPPSTAQQIDSVFRAWNTPGSPGCAIGIVRNDSLIYAKGYGMANLETGTPITPETVFCLASVSKQFTGYSIVLLARQGKLRLDDDIHTYLPWMPAFKQKITIRHLLNHTSGLRDGGNAVLLGGVGFEGLITQQLALDYIKNATGLNFPPGTKHVYSNTNYILLAEIIKQVSGQSVNDFARANIFGPLGMTHARYVEQPGLIIRDRAVSYAKTSQGGYENTFNSVYTVGDGGSYASVRDLARWVTNFYHPKAGDQQDMAQLVELGQLLTGQKLTYAKGIYSNTYRGLTQYTHGGSVASYRTNIAVLPALNMGIIILANDATLDPAAKSNELIDLFLKNRPAARPAPAAVTAPSAAPVASTSGAGRLVRGSYLGDDGAQMSFPYLNRQLFLAFGGQQLPLSEVAPNTFTIVGNPGFRFVFAAEGKDSVVHMLSSDTDRRLVKYTAGSLSAGQLQPYAGIYHSPELDLFYTLRVHSGRLVASSLRSGSFPLKVLNARTMLLEHYGAKLSFLRDSRNQLTGFTLSNGGLVAVPFRKLN
ncbi:serine hydrolase domain-containing protein [Hymenobacter yonginensis]|uniref:Serine hydrolase n=1 Tax=Hymenobacter yonginensis TaxID=748197 RepID=A0ABY7PVN7_9BACT|nr:serine hydrolase domain-containing protein [Hymenobacter yonginensis]WBO86735.1 serine hydrolase [Hymenobacter yonginensis]